MYEKLGAHLGTVDGVEGANFAVWAPNAGRVCVIGDFNSWDRDAHPLSPRASSGIWEGFVPGVQQGAIYKYRIESRDGRHGVDKADPLAAHTETPPKTGSVVWDLGYQWSDADWMRGRARRNALDAPISVYEVHLGSWRRVPEEGNRPLTYRELAEELPRYVKEMGFTHVELLPVMEHPFYGSWGYQTTGYFAPTSRYGTPQDFMHLIDRLHQEGIGVILDWVPSHFPADEHGLAYFDGTHLYEHADPRRGFHPDWKSAVFNYGRNEVRSFLLSSALSWLDRYHADGLRVDAVASMLYLDYSRQPGEWLPNEYGGNENLEAVAFLRHLNEAVYGAYPDVQTIAEESTAWPMVSRPTYVGGLGFGLKWDMGWMHDTLRYFAHDPVHRRYHHNDLTFRMIYAFTENYVLSLSHDEVVYGKRSLLSKMPGDGWQKAANLRLLFAYMFTQPGKKLIFMGGEFGQWAEWDHESGLDWAAAESDYHADLRRFVQDVNALYSREPALHALDCRHEGFEWVDANDADQSVLTYLRRAGDGAVLVAANFTPVPREGYRIGVPFAGHWREILNSDADIYGGSGAGNLGGVTAAPEPMHGRPFSVTVTIPPLAAILFKYERGRD
jgi:1,4-alpha-glucan branching enzyme